MKRIFSFVIAAFVSTSAFAQIPNAGFETWATGSGYDTPTGWDQLNAMTSSSSVFTCLKGTPGNPGTSYLKLVSKTAGSMGVMPGITCSGLLDQSSMSSITPKSGFPNVTRPVSLTGNWQYMAYGSDQGYIMVLLSKWNSTSNMRDTVAYVKHLLPGMVMSWGAFTIPLTYKSGALPDSALICLSASGSTPVNNSYLYVDNLSFTGTVPAALNDIAENRRTFSLYPNPASGIVNLQLGTGYSGGVTGAITDVAGRELRKFSFSNATATQQLALDISQLPKGTYIVSVTIGQTTHAQKLVIE